MNKKIIDTQMHKPNQIHQTQMSDRLYIILGTWNYCFCQEKIQIKDMHTKANS